MGNTGNNLGIEPTGDDQNQTQGANPAPAPTPAQPQPGEVDSVSANHPLNSSDTPIKLGGG